MAFVATLLEAVLTLLLVRLAWRTALKLLARLARGRGAAVSAPRAAAPSAD